MTRLGDLILTTLDNPPAWVDPRNWKGRTSCSPFSARLKTRRCASRFSAARPIRMGRTPVRRKSMIKSNKNDANDAD